MLQLLLIELYIRLIIRSFLFYSKIHHHLYNLLESETLDT